MATYVHSKLLAHTADNGAEERLDDHLEAVAKKTREFAQKYDAGDIGFATGLLHDLGKAKLEFQAYIRGERGSEPHSGEGARFAVKHYTRRCPVPFDAPLGRIMAFAIAGHHSGLANGADPGGGTRPLDDRLQDAEDISLWFKLPVLQKAPQPLLTAKSDAFAWAFFTRMLFSALIDADRLATERWSAEAIGGTIERDWPGELEDLKWALDLHLAEKFPLRSDASELARLRAEVLADCRAAADRPTGLFSLSVPTGGGKTLSSLAFALDHAIRRKLDRVIYVIPFTSIVEQTAQVFREALGDADAVLEHHSAFDEDKLSSRLGREEDRGIEKLRLAAQNWNRPIVVTTAVQFFESLFANKPSRCRKLHNIARSVVILDEAQMLPIKLLRPCLAAIQELVRGYGTSVVLCTATQPAVTQQEFAKAASSRPPPEALTNVHEIIRADRNLERRLKRVHATVADTLTDGQLVEALAGVEQGMAIVNNRRHARELFRMLRDGGVAGARHLTTAMTAAHRQHVLAQIRDDLYMRRRVRLVSTSLIEAGVDVSFEAVWRAWAGLDQIVQAAGRCNRNGELGPNGGRLTIFAPEEKEGRGIPNELKSNADAAARVLRAGLDPLAPEATTAYFRELLWTRDDGGRWLQLDAAKVGEGELGYRGIMTAIEQSARGLNFAFADIAQAFRIIEETMVPVIVPAWINGIAGAPQHLIDSIPHVKSIGGVARDLQRHVVQIPRRDRDRLIAAGSARAIAPDKLGEQFVELSNKDIYDDQSGLDWDDPGHRSASSLIL